MCVRSSGTLVLLAGALALCAGCMGSIEADHPGDPLPGTIPLDPSTNLLPKDPRTDEVEPTNPTDPANPLTQACGPAPARLWQLTPLQVYRTLDGLGGALEDQSAREKLALYALAGPVFESDPVLHNTSVATTMEYFEIVRTAARLLGERPERVDACLGQSEPSMECVETSMRTLAKRALRQELAKDELQDLLKSYAAQRSALGHREAVALTIRRVLGRPEALFRSELGGEKGEDGLAHLTPWEVASFVSYTLTDAPPDRALVLAAEDGSLAEPTVVRAQVERLLSMPPKAVHITREEQESKLLATGLMRFFREWLDLEKLEGSSHAQFSKEAKLEKEETLRWLDNETMLFVRQVLWEGDGTLKSILSASGEVADASVLSRYYALGNEPGSRDGILMKGGFLITHHSTTTRGRFIRERLLCVPISEPDESVNTDLTEVTESLQKQGQKLSPRQIRAQHMDDAGCAGCHSLIDPLGFPFDTFAPNGLPRQSWDGFEIDPKGEIVGTRESNAKVENAQDLVEKLSESPDVRRCFVKQLYHFVHGQAPRPLDRCRVKRLEASFERSGGNVRQLMLEMVSDPETFTRTPLSL